MTKKINILLPSVILLLQTIVAQTTVCAFINQRTGTTQKMNFTFSKTEKDDKVFNTEYHVLDNNKLPFKIISVSNNTAQQTINVTMRSKTGEVEEEYPVNYNQFSGLVLTEAGDSIPKLDKEYNYLYLLSFDEPSKQFVNIHYITKLSSYAVMFRKVADSLLVKNKEFLKQAGTLRIYMEQQEITRKAEEQKQRIEAAEKKRIDSLVAIALSNLQAAKETTPPKQETFAKIKIDEKGIASDNIIVRLLDSLCLKFIKDSMRVDKMYQDINAEIRKHNSEEMDIRGEERYTGDKKGDSWQGNGLMEVANRRIYLGTFASGQFVKGIVILRYENGNKYVGMYEQARPYGFGQFTWSNKEMSLGNFGENGFEKGIARRTENGNYYFGEFSFAKKNGFGIYTAIKGNQYIGIFKDDKFQNGYSVEVDDMGVKTFFEIVNSSKNQISPKEWQKFADEYNRVKLQYGM